MGCVFNSPYLSPKQITVRTFFFSILLLAATLLHAQHIVTGQVQPNDHFYDYAPDTSIYISSTVGTAAVPLDLNGDGSSDVTVIARYHMPWNWGHEMSFLLQPSSHAEIAQDHIDSCYTQDNVPLLAMVSASASAYPYGIMIDASATWADSALYLQLSKSDVSQPPGSLAGMNCSSHTFDTTYAYAGVRIFTPDTLYGWIAMKITHGTPGTTDTLRISSFACQTMLVGISTEETASAISFYPNPSTGIFTCSTIFTSATMTITDVTGRVVLSRTLKNAAPVADLSGNADGVYFLSIQTGSGVLTQRLVVCH